MPTVAVGAVGTPVKAGEAREVTPLTTFVPSHLSSMDCPLGTTTPVPAAVLSVMSNPPVTELVTKYSLLTAGQMMSLASPGAPVATMNMRRASSVAPLLTVRVYGTPAPPHVLMVVVPAIAASVWEVIPLLTVTPHEPDNSPVAGNVSRRFGVYELGMGHLRGNESAQPAPCWPASEC